jgi:hypothetical protein
LEPRQPSWPGFETGGRQRQEAEDKQESRAVLKMISDLIAIGG